MIKEIQKAIMTIDDKIKDVKVQNEITRKAAKISASSSVKFQKHKNVTGETIFSPDQNKLTERSLSYRYGGKILTEDGDQVKSILASK